MEIVDSTLQFAQRRNVPVRYDRTLWEKTMQAMTRIQEIRLVSIGACFRRQKLPQPHRAITLKCNG
jgi:large subunit ribosomal protein L24e